MYRRSSFEEMLNKSAILFSVDLWSVNSSATATVSLMSWSNEIQGTYTPS